MKTPYQHKTYEHVRKEFRFEISRIYERGFFSTKLMPMMMSILNCQLQCRISIADALLIKLMSDCDTFFVIFRLLFLPKCKKKVITFIMISTYISWIILIYFSGHFQSSPLMKMRESIKTLNTPASIIFIQWYMIMTFVKEWW